MAESSRPRPPGSRPDDAAAGSEPRAAERPDTARTYDEREVAAVLERAAQLQRDEPGDEHGPAPKPGLTLGELEQIAAEAGIDPALVRRAAGDVATRAAAARSRSPLLGGPTELTHELSLPGLLTEVELAAVAERIRRELGELGALELSEGALLWRSGSGKRTVSLRAVAGRTLVVVERKLPGGSTFGGVVGGVGGGLGGAAAAATVTLGGSLPLAALLFAGCFVGTFLLLRLAFRALVLQETRTAERLLEALSREITSRAQPAGRAE